MICFTERRGLSEENGSWKTTCIFGRNGRISAFDFASSRVPFQSIVAAVVVKQPQDRLAERRLAGARLADDAERLAVAKLQGHIVDRDKQPVLAGEEPAPAKIVLDPQPCRS